MPQLVARYNPICITNDGVARAVVCQQLHAFCAREISLEFEQVLGPSRTPAINCLIDIADNADVAMRSHYHPQDFKLSIISVLKLVDKNMAGLALH